MKDKKNKKKREKVVYIDDGSSISDMSGVGGIGRGARSQKRDGDQKDSFRSSLKPRASLKEQFETYIGAVRLMFLPMLAVLGIIALAFLIVYIIL